METNEREKDLLEKIEVVKKKIEATADQVELACLTEELQKLIKEKNDLCIAGSKLKASDIIDAPIVADNKKNNNTTGGAHTTVRLF
jgi:hypothetical protein